VVFLAVLCWTWVGFRLDEHHFHISANFFDQVTKIRHAVIKLLK